MLVRVVLALACLSGCLEPDLVSCGEQSCPGGEVCAAGTCVDQDQINACVGLPDGAPCTPTVSAPGTCRGGACVQYCGDGVVEANEQCDDANHNASDGCDECTLTTWQATATIGGSVTATSYALARPFSVATDRHGNVYIATLARILRVDPGGTITTFAGTGTTGYSGDGGPATSANIDLATALVVDGLDNLYFSDSENSVIRKVDVEGIITTVAGNGMLGYGGDGGPALSATIRAAPGLAVDGLGNLYIADGNNHRIRRVDPSGTITTIAGTGVQGFSGDGGLATAAQLYFCDGVAVDAAGNIYIVDQYNQRVRKVTNGVITTIAGTGGIGETGDGGPALAATFNYPYQISVDPAGNLYLPLSGDGRVRKIDTNGMISTVAGNGVDGFAGDGGLAVAAELGEPQAVAFDLAGDMFIADADDNHVRRVDPAGIITTIAGTGANGYIGDGGAATSALFQTISVALDPGGSLYISDDEHYRIRRVDANGVITTVAGTGSYGSSGDDGPATSAEVVASTMVFDAAGNLYLGDAASPKIRRIDTSGIITTIAGTGTAGGGGDGGPATDAQLMRPNGLAFDSAGNLYISDPLAYRVRRIDPGGTITNFAGTGTMGFGGDNGPATSAEVGAVTGVAVDGSDNVYILDYGNQRVRRVDTAGMITTVAGNGTKGGLGNGGPATSAELDDPQGIAVDHAGNIYINDTDDRGMRWVNTQGVIDELAACNGAGFRGDGGPAPSAQMQDGVGVVIDSHGAVITSDQSFVRRIANGTITTIAGPVEPAGMGPLAQAQLADPRALVIGSTRMFVAGGSSGTVQAIDATSVNAVVGRYPQTVATGMAARFRSSAFGTVVGVAYDEAAGLLYLTESNANRIHVVTMVDPTNADTWTIAPLANVSGTAGFADGPTAAAMFRGPTGLYLDPTAQILYVADTGNHVIRAIDLAAANVQTVIGSPATRGFYGDGGPAQAALLFAPEAIDRCPNGDFFVADTGNNRIRRIDTNHTISTVLGDGTPASSGEGTPASTFPINTPLGLACDALGNVYATSTTTVREVPANDSGVVDGTGPALTIYGAAPRTMFPANVTSCLTGVAVANSTTLQVLDCTGLLVQLARD